MLLAMKPKTAERILYWLLIVMGGMAASAIVPAAMPTRFMVAINDWLGLGPYPHSTLTEYLTRSLSILYAMLGALTIYVACDVRRYRDLLVFMGWLTVVLGAALTVLDFAIGMPARWSWGEGPPTIVVGLAIVWLARRVE